MRKLRGAATLGGTYAGAILGSVAGLVEAFLFLEGGNFLETPGSSIVFILLSMSLYALSMSIAGALLGWLASCLPYEQRERAAGPYGYPFAAVLGALIGIFVFVLGTWWARYAPPDLAVFRRYCRTETFLVALVSVAVGRAAFHLIHPIAKLERAERFLAARWVRRQTFVKLAAGLVFLIAVLSLEPIKGRRDVSPAGAHVNVVLITIDTLRADHLEYLGYLKPTSPVSREMSEQAVVFREAVAQYPLTTPSHASILTGRYVRSHGATGNAIPLHESAVLLSEVLRDNGYTTAAFVTSPIIGSKYGFDRGFDYFVERNRGDFTKSSFSDWIGQLRLPRVWWRLLANNRTTAAAARWLEEPPDAPFFLWLHYITPHAPYAPPFSFEREWDVYESSIIPSIRDLRQVNAGDPALAGEDIEHIAALYDADIAFTESLVGRLFDILRRRGILESTLVVFTADHGESLYDRSFYFGHGRKLYDEEILVPLFFRCPARIPAGVTIEEPVETIHIAPTIVDFLGLPPEPSFQGMSLMNIIDPGSRDPEGSRPMHPSEEKPAFAINHKSRMIRFGGWKYIETDDEFGTEELYNLADDPGETENLVDSEREKADELRTLLRTWDASVPVVRSGDHELDEESVRALRALGYVN